MKIRIARKEDALQIAIVHVDSWRSTYKGIIPDSFLQNLSYEQRKSNWDKNIADPSTTIFVVEDEQGVIVGFSVVGERVSNLQKETTDLQAIYLLERVQNKGIGKQLLLHTVQHALTEGYTQMFVEVLKENKTLHFYEYYDATYIETRRLTIGGKVLDEAIYCWHNLEQLAEKIHNSVKIM